MDLTNKSIFKIFSFNGLYTESKISLYRKFGLSIRTPFYLQTVEYNLYLSNLERAEEDAENLLRSKGMKIDIICFFSNGMCG